MKSEKVLNLPLNYIICSMKHINKTLLINLWTLMSHTNLNSIKWMNVYCRIKKYLIIFRKSTRMNKFLKEINLIKSWEIVSVIVFFRLTKMISADMTWKLLIVLIIASNSTLKLKTRLDPMVIKLKKDGLKLIIPKSNLMIFSEFNFIMRMYNK